MTGVSIRQYGFAGVSVERARELDAWLAGHAHDCLLEVARDETSSDALHLWPAAYAAMGEDVALEELVASLAVRRDFPAIHVDDRQDALERAKRVRSDAARLALFGLVSRSWSPADTELVIGALSECASGRGVAKLRAACAHAIEPWLRFGSARDEVLFRALELLRELACRDPEPLVRALSAVVLVRSHGGIEDLQVRAALCDSVELADEIAVAWNAFSGGAWVFDVATPDPPDGARDAGAFRQLLTDTFLHAAASRLGETAEWLTARARSADGPERAARVEQLLGVLFAGEPLENGTPAYELPGVVRRALAELASMTDGAWTEALARYALPASPAALRSYVDAPIPQGHRALLEGLDEVPWADLEHAYGSAEDVPALVRALASRDVDRREGALDAFYMGPCHQGSRYSATVRAVPFLVELTQSPRVLDRHRLLDLIAHIALGYPSDLTVSGRAERQLDGDECADFASERRCYEAVGESAPVWLELTRAGEHPKTRITASALLGWYPAQASRSTPRLLELASDAAEPERLRASALLALSHLNAELPALGASAGSPRGPIGPLGAARVIARARRAEGLADLVHAIAGGVTDDTDDEDPFWTYPWGSLERHLPAAVALFDRLTAQDAIEGALAEETDPGRAGRLCRALLELVFERSKASYSSSTLPAEESFDERNQRHKASGWTERQRRAIAAVVASDAAWHGAGAVHHADSKQATETQRALRATLGLSFHPTRKALERA